MGSQRALPALLAEDVVPLRLRRVVAFMSTRLRHYVEQVKRIVEGRAQRGASLKAMSFTPGRLAWERKRAHPQRICS